MKKPWKFQKRKPVPREENLDKFDKKTLKKRPQRPEKGGPKKTKFQYLEEEE